MGRKVIFAKDVELGQWIRIDPDFITERISREVTPFKKVIEIAPRSSGQTVMTFRVEDGEGNQTVQYVNEHLGMEISPLDPETDIVP